MCGTGCRHPGKTVNKLDARRLTGINVIWQSPGAVVDVALNDHDDATQIGDLWQSTVQSMLEAVGWHHHQTTSHHFAGGLALALSAPIDALYAAVEIAEWAWDVTEHTIKGADTTYNLESSAAHFREMIRDEQNPALIRLADDAARHQVTLLSDDDKVSVGLGRGSTTWAVNSITNEIEWSEHFDVPVGLVTGTNGKTTTVRLTQHILQAAGLNVGISSTDWIGVNEKIIDRGDYSGPGGARTVLRQKQVDVAVLETARGGLLRRGLGVPRADAALITNIAEDHLGDFGSQNLQELLDLKWIVMKALDRNSIAILNADDPLLTSKATELDVPICWFSLHPELPLLQRHCQNSGSITTVIDGQVSRYDGTAWHPLCAVNDIPVTLNGSARHNIANALAAVALSHALGANDSAIARGLQSMNADDNPGRCNFFRVRGCDVLLDFAHNPSAMQAIFDIASTHPAKRRILCFGQAGDRTDQLIFELAANAWAIGLDYVMISELADYRRGREPGEVFKLLHEGLIKAGARSKQISHHDLERESLDHALNIARPGDLIIMLALADSKGILEYLQSVDGT